MDTFPFKVDPYLRMAHVQQAIQDAETRSRGWHNNIIKWRKLYNFDHYDKSPKEGEPQYADPIYTNVVDTAVGIILANDLEFEAKSWGVSEHEATLRDIVEKFLLGLIHISNEKKEKYIQYEVLLNFIRDGSGVIYTAFDEVEAYLQADTYMIPDPINPENVASIRGYNSPPLEIEVVDPLEIFVIPGGRKRWSHVIRKIEATSYDVESRFGIILPEEYGHTAQAKRSRTGNLYDYWEYALIVETVGGKKKMSPKLYHSVVFDRFEVVPLEAAENYEDFPYVIGFFKPVDFKTSADWGHSILSPLYTTVTELEKSFNRRQHMVDVYSSLPMFIKMESGRASPQIDSVFNSTVVLNPGEEIGFPKYPGSPPDVDKQIELLRSRVQQSGFSDILFGTSMSAGSGYALSMLGDQNRIRLEQPVRHLQFFWERWAKRTLALLGKYCPNTLVRIYGVAKGAGFTEQVFTEDFKDLAIRCKIKPEFPNERSKNHAMSTQVRGVLSEETIMQNYLDIEQPQEEKKRRQREQFMNNPLIIQQQVLATMIEESKNSNDPALKMATQMVIQSLSRGGGQPQGMGQPPNPMSQMMGGGQELSAPEQLEGVASPTGMEPPQASGGLPPGQSDIEMMESMANASPQMMGGGVE